MTSAATVTDWVGYVAATLTTLSFVPQAWHTFQTRDVSGISLGMYSAFTLGVLLWAVEQGFNHTTSARRPSRAAA